MVVKGEPLSVGAKHMTHTLITMDPARTRFALHSDRGEIVTQPARISPA